MTFPMTNPIRRLTTGATFWIAMAASAQPSPPALTKMEALQRSPESAGALIYRGQTFPLGVSAGSPLYHYERRVAPESTGLIASHITSDLAGRVIIVESSAMSPSYEVKRFEVVNQQSGFAGSVQVTQNGRHLEYELNDNGKVSRASEDVSDPIVTGPSMFGFILKNWEPLKAGTTIPVRMLVLKEKTTYGFDLKFDKQANGQATFTVTPSNFLIRMAIAPLRVVFDASTMTPVRYEGRVPPMESVAGKLKDLDARVEYTPMAPAYR